MKHLLITIFIFCSFFAKGQSLLWGQRKLTADDFAQRYNNDDFYHYGYEAETNAHIGVTYRLRRDTLTFSVTAYFDKDSSWMNSFERTKNIKIATPCIKLNIKEGLGHEQIIFDIWEVYARLTRQMFYNRKKTLCDKSLSIAGLDSLSKAIDDSVRYYQYFSNTVQSQFYTETKCSKRLIKEWRENVDSWLQELERYASPRGEIVCKQ